MSNIIAWRYSKSKPNKNEKPMNLFCYHKMIFINPNYKFTMFYYSLQPFKGLKIVNFKKLLFFEYVSWEIGCLGMFASLSTQQPNNLLIANN